MPRPAGQLPRSRRGVRDGQHRPADWRDVPERYGPWQTLYRRFRRWSTDGTWERLLAHVQIHDDVGADQSITNCDLAIMITPSAGSSRRSANRDSSAARRT